MPPAPRIAVVGDNCIDLILPPGLRLVGGNAVNVAVQLARLGAASSYFGAVGRDADGDLVAEALAIHGVELGGFERRDLPTSRTEIVVEPDGDRRITHEDFGACDGYRPDPMALESFDHVHIGWLNDGGHLRRHLAARGRSVSQDVTVNARSEDLGVTGLAIVFASQEGSHDAARDLARELVAEGARGAVVTRGARGSSAFLDDTEVEAGTEVIAPVDTTGAGDSYIAAFLHARLLGRPVREAMEAGAALAALTCLHPGGFPQV